MKRGVFDVLRRALDNTVANWPLILVRLGETLLFGIIVVLTAIAVVVPFLVSVGIQIADIHTPDDLANAAFSLMNQWLLLVWAFVAVFLMLGLFVAIHSFVEAGCARVYVDGERIAGPAVDGLRGRYRVFSMERWLAGGRDGWWVLFWIYNLAWTVGALILLIPLLPTMVLMFVFRERAQVLIATGCVGIAATLLLLIFVGIVMGMWTTRAIAGWAVRRAGARDALTIAWRAIREDLGRHVLVMLAVIVVAFAGSSFFAGFSFFAALGEGIGRHHVFNFFTFPIRIASSILSSTFSAAVSSWFLAAYAALAVEKN